jgi:5-aminolevulinate synthase
MALTPNNSTGLVPRVGIGYEGFFVSQLNALRDEGRYGHFAELERIVGAFPKARLHRTGQSARDVTVWCSNDYLGTGQHPVLLEAMQAAVGAQGSAPASGLWRCSRRRHLHHLDPSRLA